MKRRMAIFVYSKDPTCLNHALINSLDLHDKGNDVLLVIEDAAINNLKDFLLENNFHSRYFYKLRELRLIAPICYDCALKHHALEDIKKLGLTAGNVHLKPDDLRQKGYEILLLVPRACNFCVTWDNIASEPK